MFLNRLNLSLAVISGLAVGAPFLSGCVSDAPSITVNSVNNQSNISKTSNMPPTSADKNGVSTDIEALAKQVLLPVRPSEAVWKSEALGTQKTSVPGPTDYRLTAILKFDKSDAQVLIKKLEDENLPEGETEIGNVEVEPWYPAGVRESARQVNGKNVVEGAKYSADSFLRSPFSSGKLIRVGKTDYFVLRLLSF